MSAVCSVGSNSFALFWHADQTPGVVGFKTNTDGLWWPPGPAGFPGPHLPPIAGQVLGEVAACYNTSTEDIELCTSAYPDTSGGALHIWHNTLKTYQAP
jgi:hypothetical protein